MDCLKAVIVRKRTLCWLSSKLSFLLNINNFKHFHKIQGDEDLDGGMNGIFLLHETYDLNLTAFSMGRIEVPGQPGAFIQSNHELSTKDLVSE